MSSDIGILLFHPSFMHVFSPANKFPITKIRAHKEILSDPIRRIRSGQQMQQEDLLESHVILPLLEQGIIASTLIFDNKKWQGIIRLPLYSVADKEMESRDKRVSSIRNKTGNFKKLNIRCFYTVNILRDSVLIYP